MIDIIIDNKSPTYIKEVLRLNSLVCPKTRSLTMNHVPAQVIEFIQNFVRVFNKFVLKIKNCSCDASKVLKSIVQISAQSNEMELTVGCLLLQSVFTYLKEQKLAHIFIPNMTLLS